MTLGGRCPLCGVGFLVEHHNVGPSGWWFCTLPACCAWFDWRRRAAYVKDFAQQVPWPESA